MKLKDIFIGKLVQQVKDSCSCGNTYIPKIGYVVDIAPEYDPVITVGRSLDSVMRILPVVKFMGEDIPRKISLECIEEVKC